MTNNPTEMTVTIAQVKVLVDKWRMGRQDMFFEQFLDTVSPVLAGDGAVSVPWNGMHLCIEKDGHCHS